MRFCKAHLVKNCNSCCTFDATFWNGKAKNSGNNESCWWCVSLKQNTVLDRKELFLLVRESQVLKMTTSITLKMLSQSFRTCTLYIDYAFTKLRADRLYLFLKSSPTFKKQCANMKSRSNECHPCPFCNFIWKQRASVPRPLQTKKPVFYQEQRRNNRLKMFFVQRVVWNVRRAAAQFFLRSLKIHIFFILNGNSFS